MTDYNPVADPYRQGSSMDLSGLFQPAQWSERANPAADMNDIIGFVTRLLELSGGPDLSTLLGFDEQPDAPVPGENIYRRMYGSSNLMASAFQMIDDPKSPMTPRQVVGWLQEEIQDRPELRTELEFQFGDPMAAGGVDYGSLLSTLEDFNKEQRTIDLNYEKELKEFGKRPRYGFEDDPRLDVDARTAEASQRFDPTALRQQRMSGVPAPAAAPVVPRTVNIPSISFGPGGVSIANRTFENVGGQKQEEDRARRDEITRRGDDINRMEYESAFRSRLQNRIDKEVGENRRQVPTAATAQPLQNLAAIQQLFGGTLGLRPPTT
jgi:hypothetical protein